MKKTLILLLVTLSSLLIASNDVNYKEKYERQVKANEDLVEYCQEINDKISQQQTEIEINKVREQERMLIYIPFTTVGISKDFTIGFIVGYGLCLIL